MYWEKPTEVQYAVGPSVGYLRTSLIAQYFEKVLLKTPIEKVCLGGIGHGIGGRD